VTAISGYEGRIGRYTRELAEAMIGVAGVRPGQRALDVGCGGGALTEPLAQLLGARQVVGVDPDEDAVEECRARLPDVAVRVGSAEALPFASGEFDVVLAQLVMTLVTNAERAAGEMRRVARSGAVVATCVWDFAEGMTVLRTFWDAALAIAPARAKERDQATYPYGRPDELEALWLATGLGEVACGALLVGADYRDFEDLWHPLVLPDGSPGRFYATLDARRQAALRDEVWQRLGRPEGGFRLSARAWYVTGHA
jgi:SAM-dependent methyltransferase